MLAQSMKINENLCVTRDKAIITALNENRFPEFYRIIIGCSSWGPGQLESELLGSRTNGNSMWCNFPYTEDYIDIEGDTILLSAIDNNIRVNVK